MAWTLDRIPDLAGRVALVTGANSGIGFETARTLARHGAKTVLGCRDLDKAATTVARIRAEIPGRSRKNRTGRQHDAGSGGSVGRVGSGQSERRGQRARYGSEHGHRFRRAGEGPRGGRRDDQQRHDQQRADDFQSEGDQQGDQHQEGRLHQTPAFTFRCGNVAADGRSEQRAPEQGGDGEHAKARRRDRGHVACRQRQHVAEQIAEKIGAHIFHGRQKDEAKRQAHMADNAHESSCRDGAVARPRHHQGRDDGQRRRADQHVDAD